MTIANPPHNGAVIHHQDQPITPVNFKTRKIKNNKLPNETPFEFELLFDIFTTYRVRFVYTILPLKVLLIKIKQLSHIGRGAAPFAK